MTELEHRCGVRPKFNVLKLINTCGYINEYIYYLKMYLKVEVKSHNVQNLLSNGSEKYVSRWMDRVNILCDRW